MSKDEECVLEELSKYKEVNKMAIERIKKGISIIPTDTDFDTLKQVENRIRKVLKEIKAHIIVSLPISPSRLLLEESEGGYSDEVINLLHKRYIKHHQKLQKVSRLKNKA